MSDYVPEVGHKVRATLGENVLVGSVYSLSDTRIDLELETETHTFVMLLSGAGWRFERIQELPTKFGAVIRVQGERSKPVTLVRTNTDTWHTLPSLICWSDSDVLREPFTVLFEGVDE